MMREAAIISETSLTNVIVIEDGPDGDALLSESCVEITNMNPKPAVGTGWSYVNGAFVAPAVPELDP
jgi:hypothetical protein